MPMSCPDPRCGLFAYVVVRPDGELVPINRLLGEEALRKHLADFSDWETLLRQVGCCTSGCGCGEEDSAHWTSLPTFSMAPSAFPSAFTA